MCPDRMSLWTRGVCSSNRRARAFSAGNAAVSGQFVALHLGCSRLTGSLVLTAWMETWWSY